LRTPLKVDLLDMVCFVTTFFESIFLCYGMTVTTTKYY